MTEGAGLRPASWKVTASTVRCERVDDFVTIMVNKDWSASCAWYNRYKGKMPAATKHRVNAVLRKKIERCSGPQCDLIAGYRERLMQEEFCSS